LLLAAIRMEFAGLDTGNDPAEATGWATSGNYFDELRIQPFLGRFFHAQDEKGANSAPYLVLSYAYWHTRFQDDRGIVGRTILVNKHPFTIIGVAPQEFRGTLAFIAPDFFIPIVEDVDGENILNTRSINNREVFEILGHLKPGVTPAQATADLNSIGAYLEKTYPKEVDHKNYTLGRPGLFVFSRPAQAFVGGLMLLAGMILLAACANLGSLFAAHAADRSREVALRLALGSNRRRILRHDRSGGDFGLPAARWARAARGAALAQIGGMAAPGSDPFADQPGCKTMRGGAWLALVSGFLFGIVPVRQVLRANPYEIVKAGPSGQFGRRLTVRDVLLVVQIAICAVLVTSSFVAVRGLERGLHSNFGFEPRNTMMAGTNLAMAGYRNDSWTAMQRRMIDAVRTIPGVERAALVNNYAPLIYAAGNTENVFKDETRELSQSHVESITFRYEVSPEYFEPRARSLLAGRDHLAR
jgi:predicted permease